MLGFELESIHPNSISWASSGPILSSALFNQLFTRFLAILDFSSLILSQFKFNLALFPLPNLSLNIFHPDTKGVGGTKNFGTYPLDW